MHENAFAQRSEKKDQKGDRRFQGDLPYRLVALCAGVAQLPPGFPDDRIEQEGEHAEANENGTDCPQRWTVKREGRGKKMSNGQTKSPSP